ncbi:MAG: polyphosphate kinase 1 [Moraxellaceae bacterium]|jgi:polyphosphate kinase|nr:polyphosphate kinase 1 [Moraxellaceae bacterium]
MATQDPASPEGTIDLSDPDFYINRELSILAFNLRVLEQALDDAHPLLERLGFLRIFSSNLDEFFEIRVAGLKRQLSLGRASPGSDGMLPHEVLNRIADICHDAVDRQYRIFNDVLLPAMSQENISFLKRDQWNEKQAAWVKKYFREQVYPVLTPIGLDPAHPFPRVVNKSLNFIVSLEGKDAFGRALNLAIVPAPRSLPRMIRLPDDIGGGGDDYVFLSSIIHEHAGELFPGMTMQGCYQFRVTRNADLLIDDVDVDDLAIALKDELLSRRYGDAVRLEVADNCPRHLVDFLLKKFGLNEEFLYRVNGPVSLARLITDIDRPRLRYKPLISSIPDRLAHASNYFDVLAQGDVLLNHPFEAFTPVVEFLRQAARDPNVLAIKQTLYRTGKNSEMVNLLAEAARNGKEVTAVIELRARFDEESNIEVAAKLQEAGAIVVYGIVGYKTHAKMLLVVRREGRKLKRYVHLGTGNYHTVTARIYTDFSLLTADQGLCEDVHKLFQQLTGMGKLAKLKKLLHAPFTLHARLMEHIENETANALAGKPAQIIARMNSLTEKQLIQALYRASQAGVTVDLIVRGICSLRPGIPGVSDRIRVRSVIGRFLEHSRVFWFENGGEEVIYCSSADWMDRNMFFRVETCFPISDPVLAKRVKQDGLMVYLTDNRQSWILQADGSYRQVAVAAGKERMAQQQLLEKLAH